MENNFKITGNVTAYFYCPIAYKAYLLLKETNISYKTIAKDTGLSYGWVQHFLLKYEQDQDFHCRKVETLIKYLSKSQ